MKNKVKVLIIVIVLLIVALGIVGTLYLNERNNREIEESNYENVRIISEYFNVGSPDKIIYNDKEYALEYEDNDIYSMKFHNGRIYYYKSEALYDYFQEELKVKELDSIFYEFGEITLNENDLTYNKKLIKQVSYAEYESGDKAKIEYCVDNTVGEYGLEIIENNYIVRKLEDITIRKNYNDTNEYILVFTKKDKNNNIIWTYKTEIGIEAQHELVGTLEITEDRIYINENGTIVVLDRETGDITWKNEDLKVTEGAFDSVYLDENQNLYIYRGSLTIIDKNGNTKAVISHEFLSGDGIGFESINEKELLIEGMGGNLIIDLDDYSIKVEEIEK